MAHRIVMLGPPAAGKGTQAARLAQELGIPHVDSGELLREQASAGTELGRSAKARMDARMVPNNRLNVVDIEVPPTKGVLVT